MVGLRIVALTLTALTGFSGLVYEVAWQKYTATLLGSHSEATAAVLGLFLGGLSLGYAVFGRVTNRVVERAGGRDVPRKLLLLYGAVEGTIGLHALAFPWLFEMVRALSFALPHVGARSGFAIDLVLVALLVLPATVLMGGTIPILTQALARALDDATRFHALVYGFNTIGAFVGALAAAFALIPIWGLQQTILTMGAVNLFAGAGFGLLGFFRRSADPSFEPEQEGDARVGVLGLVALLSGFTAMALQTVFIRIGGLSIGASEFTFAMVVAVFVLCIALGSFAVSAFSQIPRALLPGVQVALVALLLLLYRVLPDSPYWAHVIRSVFRDQSMGFYVYYPVLFLCMLGVLAIPIGLSGATLPLIFHDLRREFGGLGSAAGRIYAWNTVGSLFGALLGGYLLLFWIDLDGVYVLAIATTILSIGLLVTRWFGWHPAIALTVVPFLLALSLLPDWPQDRLGMGLFRLRQPVADSYRGPDRLFEYARTGKKIVYYNDDPTSTVAVVESSVRGTQELDYALFTNGKPDASLHGDYPTMALIALLPTLFVDDPERSFVIGYGSGVTVGELAALDSMKVVRVAEISPGVIEASKFFEEGNQGAYGNPKTEVVISDAFRALQRSEERWDIIASEPSNPWVAGTEMLYSREFLEAARDSLRPGGVYSQWMHLYEVDEKVVDLVLRTYASVFDHVAVWYTVGTDIVLLGFKDEERALDLDAMRARASRPDVVAGLRRAGIDSFPALLAHELVPVGVVNSVDLPGDLHTLVRPVLNARAAHAFFQGRQAGLPEMLGAPASAVGVRNSMLGRYVRDRGGRLTDDEYRPIAEQTCEFRPIHCGSVFASWSKDVPHSEARSATLERLRTDGIISNFVSDDLLRQLEQLYGAGSSLPEKIALAQARHLTNVYARQFHYGLPFDRDVLLEVWKRCRSGRGIGACYPERVAFERRFGPVREGGS